MGWFINDDYNCPLCAPGWYKVKKILKTLTGYDCICVNSIDNFTIDEFWYECFWAPWLTGRIYYVKDDVAGYYNWLRNTNMNEE